MLVTGLEEPNEKVGADEPRPEPPKSKSFVFENNLLEPDFNQSITFDSAMVNDDPSSSSNYDKPLYEGARITVIDTVCAILTFARTEHISAIGLGRLLQLMNLLLPVENNLPKTTESLYSNFPKGDVEFFLHYYCNKCWGFLPSKDSVCSECEVTNKKVEYFITFSVVNQLQNLFKRKEFVKLLEYKKNRVKINKDNYEDILDGGFYKQAQQFLEENDLTATWNSDGVSLYESSNFDIHPFYLVINELPPSERYKTENMLLAGIWGSKTKPHPNIFLQPIVKEMEKLKTGVKVVNANLGCEQTVRLLTLCGTCDTPARAIFLNMKGFMGYDSCPFCLTSGEKSKRTGNVMVFPFEEDLEPRTDTNYNLHVNQATESQSEVFLLNGSSISDADILRADELLCQFVQQFEVLYGVRNMSFNVHLLRHLAECVRNIGPLHSISCFMFEDLNGRHAKIFCEKLLYKWRRHALNECLESGTFSVGNYDKAVLHGDLLTALLSTLYSTVPKFATFSRLFHSKQLALQPPSSTITPPPRPTSSTNSPSTSASDNASDSPAAADRAAGNEGPESQESDVDDPESEGLARRRQKSRRKPAQQELADQIRLLESELNCKLLARRSGLAPDDNEKQISQLTKELDELKKKLKKKQDDVKRAQKSRSKKKKKMEALCEEFPEIKAQLGQNPSAGRPSILSQQPELLKTIVEIAMFSSGAEERRRDERLNTCQTLDELTAELNRRGFEISRSGVYLHLLPRDPTTREGKRHVKTAPVRLVRAQNSTHKTHADGKFATCTIRCLETLAGYLGPNQVLFMSLDDKARVPLGKTAAKVQAPMLMSLEYKVSLPDHDFPVGPRHNLIPSVAAIIEIKEDLLGKPEAVTYSGPTYICIRSGKHSSSTANTHADDFRRMADMDEYKSWFKTTDGRMKPVVIMTVDGGPDECPRYKKNIAFAVDHFKRNDLDAIFIATNAPGRSAFNRVERRMAPLSNRMAGMILPHDYYGTHLDSQGNTVDTEMELNNFKKAGETLAGVWSGMTIDGHPVLAEYIEPGGECDLPDAEDQHWYATHVRESQYMLQVVRCSSSECCGPFRSGLASVLNGFMPAPIRVQQTNRGVCAVDPDLEDGHFMPLFPRLASKVDLSHMGFKRIPYDLYCPTVRSKLANRICRTCGIYFANEENRKLHCRVMHGTGVDKTTASRLRPSSVIGRRANEVLCKVLYDHETTNVEWLDEDEVDVVGVTVDIPAVESVCPIIPSIGEWVASPWDQES
ncbi:uncharacterized protein LOC117652688 [Thrips palmi]|uniref:Uncharacterized protein LOC117652688 n=1 Tax=Thrips palmi TaxID=161013 RepID=A0A6P9ACQ8_THRPL|nr:uncharacterized protein LOC117652688 [Thrips palmi]